jgi:hypothetical protein
MLYIPLVGQHGLAIQTTVYVIAIAVRAPNPNPSGEFH